MSRGLLTLDTDAEKNKVLVLESSYTSSNHSKSFGKKYHYSAVRAYFKLLSEAQKLERELRIEFESNFFENEKFDKEGNHVFQNKLNSAYVKHRGIARYFLA